MDSSLDKYRKQISEAWADLYFYRSARQKIEQRIQDLRDLIRANANFLPDSERLVELMLLDVLKLPANIGEAVRTALLLAAFKRERLTPAQIKELAEDRGFNFSEYTNPLASVTTTLRRMRESHPPEVQFDETDGTYLLINLKQTSMVAPEFTEKAYNEVLQRVVAKGLDADRSRALMDEIGAEIQREYFEGKERNKTG